MVGDQLEIIRISELETVVKLSRGPLVVEGLWRGNWRDAKSMLPQLRQRLHFEWQKGPPKELVS